VLSYQALINQVNKGSFAPVYLFFGEEKYLQEELTDKVAVTFLEEDSEYGREKLGGNSFSLEELLARLGQPDLFARRRLLIVDNPSYLVSTGKAEENNQSENENPAPEHEKSHKAEENNQSENENPAPEHEKSHGELLANYLAGHGTGSPDSILIFLADKVDRRKKLFKLIDEKGAVVECAGLKGKILASWIRSKVSSLGKNIEQPALERLLAAGDHNLHYLSNELEKYCSYLGTDQKNITLHVVETLFSGDIQGDVFKLSDAIAGGDTSGAHDLLDLLLRRREKPLLIFFMLVRHYRLLLQAHCLMKDGLPQSEFVSALEVHPFVARKLREQAVSYNRHALEEVLLALQEVDRHIKTGRVEPAQALKLILSRIDYIQSSSSRGV